MPIVLVCGLLVCILPAAEPLPPLSDRDRFSPLVLTNTHIGFLIESRHVVMGKLALEPARADYWRRRLIENDHQLRAWELLLEAHGALAEEEGGKGDEKTCRQALAPAQRPCHGQSSLH